MNLARSFSAIVLLGFVAVIAAADETPNAPSDPKAFDKLVVDTLRDVHNKGADLYNTAKDYTGAFRIYEGSLRTIRPILSYRPTAQKLIDEGLAASDKEADDARRAFLLHETMEKVRTYLKTVSLPAKAVEPNPTKPMETPKQDVPPKPKESPAPSTGVSGKVTLEGKPVPKADVMLVSLTLPKPRVFSTTTKEDGSYTIAEDVPAGKYVVVVTGKGVPAKYSTTTTSGLNVEVKAGGTCDVELK